MVVRNWSKIRDFFTGVVFFAVLATIGLGSAHNASAAVTIECEAPAAAAVASPAMRPPAASPVAFPSGGGSLTVFAAASLTDVFTQIETDLEAANPGLDITYNFAGSQALVTQLAEGAPADVFASASNKAMAAAVEQGSIDGSPVVFTQNRLAVVVPKENPADIATFADLGNEGIKLVLAQSDVPVGQYARESLCNAGGDVATFGAGFVENVAGNVVSEEDNVKAVLAKVQLGEADAGIVYTTDITADVAGDVTMIEIPRAVNVVARYPIAPVTDGNAELSAAFIDYVAGPEGQATLQSFGFEPKP